MKTTSLILSLPLLFSACSHSTDRTQSNGTQSNDWKSGSRLQAQVYQAGTTKLFKTWHDTQLDVDCAFAPASDGQTRCVPENVGQTNDFADSNCTQAVWMNTDALCTSPSSFYFRSLAPSATGCLNGVGPLFKSASQATLSMTYFINPQTGQCQSSSGPANVYTGTAVDPSSLVAAKSSVLPVGERLAIEQLTADDGATQLRAISDRQRNVECLMQLGQAPAAPIDRCIPAKMATLDGEFGDADCMTAVATYSCGATPNAIDTAPPTDTGCPSLSAVEAGLVEVGPAVTTYGQDETGACVAYPSGNSYSIGAPIPITSLAAIAYDYEGGGGHVVAQTATAPTGERLRALTFYDKTAQTTCTPQIAGDGQLRCLPPFAEASVFFADAGCTQPVLEVLPSCGLPTIAVQVNPDACISLPLPVFSIGARLTTALFINTGSSCAPTMPENNFDYYLLGNEIAPTTFEAVTLMAD